MQLKTEQTATLILFNQNPHQAKRFPLHVALRWHGQFEKWLPPGGHLENELYNELPHECALRECREELSISEIELFQQPPSPLNGFQESHCRSLITPFLSLLENIPSSPKQIEHQHLDWVYLGFITHHLPQLSEIESSHWQWMSRENIEQMNSDLLFPETRISLLYLFDKFSDQTYRD